MAVSGDGTLQLFDQLAGRFLNHDKACLGQPKLNVQQKRRLLKKRLFDALFSNLTGPHSYGLHSDGVSKSYGFRETEELLGQIYDLRVNGDLDRANQLQHFLDTYLQGGGQDVKGRVLRLLLQLAHTVPNQESYRNNEIGRNVFKPPLVFSQKELPKLLPPGPRTYGDSRLPNTTHQLFTHFPSEVFRGRGVGAYVETPSLVLEASLFSQPPGHRLPFIFHTHAESSDAYGRHNQGSLFGALVHSHSSSLSTRLEIPALADNLHFNGIQVPKLFEMPGDEGYESSTLTTSPSIESLSIDSGHATLCDDIWDVALKDCPTRYLAWETVGRARFDKALPFLTEAGTAAFDALYRRHCETLRLLEPSVRMPSDTKLSIRALVAAALNLLIGVPSRCFTYNVESAEFEIVEGVTLHGLSMTSVRNACSSLLECATHYSRLDAFARPLLPGSYHYKGLIFQAFTEGLRRFLQYYRGYILSLSHDLTLLQLSFTLSTTRAQLRFLTELCGCALHPRTVPPALTDGCFPTGVALLSYLYDECVASANFHHYPVLLALLSTTAKPYIMFITEWVFHGVHRDVYGEFLIEVDYDYLTARDETYWTHGYRLTPEARDVMLGKAPRDSALCVPAFLRDLVNEIYVCGKSINLLRTVAPQHFLLTMEHDMPRVRIMYSEEELRVLEVTCATYASRMRAIARQLTLTKEEMRARAERARQELIERARQAAVKHMQQVMEKKKELKDKKDEKKRKLLADLRSQMESDVRRKAAAEEAEKEQDRALMASVTRTELVDTRVEEELERQAREEIIEYYAKLSSEATRREQKALWLVQRRRLAMQRTAFLQQDELQLLQQLEHNPIYETDEDADIPAEDNQRTNKTDLPAWAKRGLENAGPAFGLDETDTSNLPKWAQTMKDRALLEIKEGKEEVTNEPEIKSHPSQSSIQNVLKMSDNQATDKENTPRVVLATDVPHVSQTSKQGLLRLDGVSDEMSTETSKRDLVTLKELKAAKELHDKHVGPSPEEPKQHPSASVIQDYMYPTEKIPKKETVKENIDVTKETVVPDSKIEIEVQKRLKEKIASHVKSPAVKKAPVTHVKLSATMHATTESQAEETFKPTIKSSGGITTESQPADEFTPHIKAIHGQSATMETADNETETKPHIRTTEGRGATVESTDEYETVKVKKSLTGTHVSEETKEEIEKFHLKVNPNKHANRESSPAKIKIFKPSIFGHVSQVSQMAEYDILAPKLKKTMQNYSNKESDWRTYQVKACRRKVKGREVSQMSDQVDAPVARIKNTADRHVSQESAHVDRDAIRLDRFKKQNVHGHAADSSAQRLLYGKNYGTGQLFADQSFEDDMSDVPRTGDMDFWTETELLPFEDDFSHLCSEPKLDLMLGQTVSDFGGMLALHSGAEDISAHEYVSLPAIMKRSIATPLLTQISLVNTNLLNHFTCELEVGRHFSVLRRYMLMQDGEFSQTLSDQLFQKLSLGPSVHEMFNPLYLNAVLQRALQSSLRGHTDNPDINFVVHGLPAVLQINKASALECLELTYRVQWPLNVVVTDACLRFYGRIFTFMLQLKRAVWTLNDVWSRLKRDATVHKASDGAQFRQLQLFKHEMQHVVKVLQGYIANQVIEVTWQEFQHDLQTSVTSLDELIARHCKYLGTCESRCLLNEKAQRVMGIIQELFSLIFRFGTQLTGGQWSRDEGQLCHSHFEHLCSTYKSFQNHSNFLFKVVSLLAARGYQPHLQELVLRLNFNGHYQAVP